MFTTVVGRTPLGLARPLVPLRALSLKPNFARFKKIEQPPGHIVGTVNDAYKIPLVSFYEGSYHWLYERLLSMGLVPMVAFPFVFGPHYPMVDTAFCLMVLFHSHCGLKSCIIDYIPERVYGVWHKMAGALLSLGSFVSMYGIYVLETSGNGLFDLLTKIWAA